jgi:hypothetical protein
VPKADFTYEVRKLPVDPVGIEDYVVRTSDGETAGTVADVLERAGGERLLVVEAGVPPVKTLRRAVRWDAVDHVDHEAVAVWLTLDEDGFAREALELDPALAVEQGEGAADARRVVVPAAGAVPEATARNRGPVDRTTWATAFAVFALMSFSALVAAIVVSLSDDALWALLFLVPTALAVLLAVLGYRTYRQPYEPRGARKP